MKNMRADYSLYDDVPELEETEFTPAFSRGSWLEDSNDIGEIGDSFSIGLDGMDIEETFASDA